MIWNSPWLGIGLIYALLGLSLYVLQRGKARQKFSPEVRRKSLHVIMGLSTLSFPWLFDHWWPVALLAGTTLILLWIMRRSRGLSRSIGSALHDVKRDRSYGELYFPLGVLTLYLLGGHNFLLYTIPLLTLTLADAAAALVGQRYGQKFYMLLWDRRSWEGSCAFFCIALFCTQTVLLCSLTGGLSGIEMLAVSLLFALSMTFVEAFSWSGLDNLFLPVIGFFVLAFLLWTPLFAALFLGISLIILLLWRIGQGYTNDFNFNRELTYVRFNQSFQQHPATTILHPHLWYRS